MFLLSPGSYAAMAKDHMVISLFKGTERRMHAKDTQLASSTHTHIGRAEIIGEL